MDIAIESVSKRRNIKRAIWSVLGVGSLIGLTVGLSQLEPALPSMPLSSIQIGDVKQGSMLRDVRGTGTLVPEDVLLIPAMTAGRVEQIHVLPGTLVESETVLLELSDPQLELDTVDAEWKLKSAEAELESLKTRLRNELLERRASVARTESGLQAAQLRHEVNRELYDEGLISENNLRLSGVQVEELVKLYEIEQQRLLRSLRGTYLNLKSFIPLAVKYNMSSEFPSYYSHRYLHEEALGLAARAVDTIMSEGLEHHYGVAYGDVTEELVALAGLLDLDVVHL